MVLPTKKCTFMQMSCVKLLLKAGAAMTERQLAIILEALPTLEDS